MVEEVKPAGEIKQGQREEDQMFINEEQFENVVPEFGTCGGGANDPTQEEEEKAKPAKIESTPEIEEE